VLVEMQVRTRGGFHGELVVQVWSFQVVAASSTVVRCVKIELWFWHRVWQIT